MLSLATFVFALPQAGRIARRASVANLNVTTTDLIKPKINPFYSGNCPPRPAGWPSFIPWCLHTKPPAGKVPKDVKRSTLLDARESVANSDITPDIAVPKIPFVNGNCPPRPPGWPIFLPWCVHTNSTHPPPPPPKFPFKDPLVEKRAPLSDESNPSESIVSPQTVVELEERDSVSSSAGGRMEAHYLFTLSFVMIVAIAVFQWI